MGLTLTLTDAEIPASPAFIDFLYTTIKGEAYHAGEWYKQDEESLASTRDRYKNIQGKASTVLADEMGKKAVLRSYRYFKEMLTGRITSLKSAERFAFNMVVGIPRTGGTYLTKQLFRACEIDYKTVQNAVAHDGFPHLDHLAFRNKSNVHTNSLLQVAEYLTMVEIYFGKHNKLQQGGKIVVPKKFTKGVYNFSLIDEVLGENARYIITLRHPLSMIQSVMEKSGGMPKGGRFALRSAIERWALNDWVHHGYDEAAVREMDYVEVLLGYWKRFHFQMAITGMPRTKNALIVPYSREGMTGAVSKLYKEFGVKLKPEEFKLSEQETFSKSHTQKANTVLKEVNAFWESLDLEFPIEALSKRC